MKKDLEELFESNYSKVYGFIYSLCRDVEAARELTQESFLKAIESIDRYNGKCKFSVWLCQIGRHLWYQYLEKRKREMPVGDDIYTLADGNAVSGNPEDEVICRSEAERVLDEIMRLSEEAGTVMLLRILQDMSFKEIGYVLSKSENWARVTYFRAKEKVIKELS